MKQKSKKEHLTMLIVVPGSRHWKSMQQLNKNECVWMSDEQNASIMTGERENIFSIFVVWSYHKSFRIDNWKNIALVFSQDHNK